MIYSKLENIDKYSSLHPLFSAAFDALNKYANSDAAPGKYIIDGDNLFLNVQSYTTSGKDKFEQHLKYIDIQYVIRGKENIKVTTASEAEMTDSYNDYNDCALYKSVGCTTTVEMSDGSALILFPEDLHNPGLPQVKESNVRKIVVKVKI